MTGRRRRSRATNLVAVPVEDSGPSRRRLWGIARRVVALVAGLAIVAGAGAGLALSLDPARADVLAAVDCPFGGGTNTNLGPESGGVGTTSWVPNMPDETFDPGASPPYYAGRDQRYMTLWELAGARGLTWSYAKAALHDKAHDDFALDDAESNLTEDCSPVNAAAGNLAQMMFEVSRFLGGLTIGLKQMATNSRPFEAFYDQQETLVDGLRLGVFIPSLTLGVVVAGIWMLLRLRKRHEEREAYAGVIGSAALTIALVAILIGGNYRELTEFLDDKSTQLNSAVLNMVAATDDGNPVRDPCYIPAPVEFEDKKRAGRVNAYKGGQRQTTCMVYKMLLYNPWHIGQFGTKEYRMVDHFCYRGGQKDDQADPKLARLDDCSEEDQYTDGCQFSPYRCQPDQRPEKMEKINIGVQQVVAQAYTHDEVLYSEGQDVPDGVTFEERDSYNALWKMVQYAVAHKFSDSYHHWRGFEPASRMATALSAGVMNLIMFVMVGAIAILVIFWHGVMFVAWILLPIAAAVAIVPPARRIVMGVIGLLVQALFLRVVLGMVLVILLAIMNAINVANGSTAWKIILMLIAAAAIWKIISALRFGNMAPASAGGPPPDTSGGGGGGVDREWDRRESRERVGGGGPLPGGGLGGGGGGGGGGRRRTGGGGMSGGLFRASAVAAAVGMRAARRTTAGSGRRRLDAEQSARQEVEPGRQSRKSVWTKATGGDAPAAPGETRLSTDDSGDTRRWSERRQPSGGSGGGGASTPSDQPRGGREAERPPRQDSGGRRQEQSRPSTADEQRRRIRDEGGEQRRRIREEGEQRRRLHDDED